MTGIVVLLREAFYALPEGSIQDRTAYVMRRRAELERGIDSQPVPRYAPNASQPKAFSQVADATVDAAMRRLCGEAE